MSSVKVLVSLFWIVRAIVWGAKEESGEKIESLNTIFIITKSRTTAR